MGVGRALTFGCVVLVSLGCAAAPEVKASVAKLAVKAVPLGARVYIDGHFAGSARVLADKPEELAPGLHLVTIVADDHFPHDLQLDLAPGTTTVRVKLRRRPSMLAPASK